MVLYEVVVRRYSEPDERGYRSSTTLLQVSEMEHLPQMDMIWEATRPIEKPQS